MKYLIIISMMYLFNYSNSLIIAQSKNNVIHPVLKHDIKEGQRSPDENSVKYVMNLTDEQLLAYIPDKTVNVHCECPKCYGGSQGFSVFEWKYDNPNEMKCKYCGTVFPNKEYPETETLTGQNSLNESISYNYYLNKSNGVKHFFSANLLFYKRYWLEYVCQDLSIYYARTKNEKYAEKLIFILDHLSEKYLHYPAMRNFVREFYFEKQKPPYTVFGGRWGYFYNEISRLLVYAYDLIYDSPSFKSYSIEKGFDVRKKIEDNYFKVAEYIAESKAEAYVANIIGYDPATSIMLGLVINKPEFIHWPLKWILQTINAGFCNDGIWHESPGYQTMAQEGLKFCFQFLDGYTDPKGFKDSILNIRLQNFKAERDLPFWNFCRNVLPNISLPNGNAISVADTPPYLKIAEKRDNTTSILFPEYGLASLGYGNGDNQIMGILHYGGNFGHGHFDVLNLNIWAKSKEMVSDIGYTFSQMRHWTMSSLGHNLVVVDKKDQTNSNINANLAFYFQNINSISIVEANSAEIYKSVPDISLYNRLVLLIPTSPNNSYIVDIFSIKGGKIHDWTLNGDSDEDMTVSTNLKLNVTKNSLLDEKVEWKEPSGEFDNYDAYGMVRSLRTCTVANDFYTEYTYVSNSMLGVRSHFLIDKPMELYIGKSPSVRRIGSGNNADNRKVYDFWMPKVILRDSSSTLLNSVFIVVHEPYKGNYFIKKIEKIKTFPENINVKAIKISYGDTTDVVIYNPPNVQTQELKTDDGISFKGRIGIVRKIKNETKYMWLFEGEKLYCDNIKLNSKPSYNGSVINIFRIENGDKYNGFEINGDVVDSQDLNDKWILLKFSNNITKAFEIDKVLKNKGNTIVRLKNDPGLKMSDRKIVEIHSPLRTFDNNVTYTIPLCKIFGEQIK